MADVREQHRVARERDRDRGHELEPLGVLGRERERQERIARDLRGHAAVVAGGFERARARRNVREVGRDQSAVDLHGCSS